MNFRELAIVGGGPVGLSAALAAAQHGIEVLVLDAQDDNRAHDPRVFALSHATRLLLERLGVWTHLGASHPIRVVHVSERGAFGAATLSADALGLKALGYVVAQADLLRALRRRVMDTGIECVDRARVFEVTQRPDDALVRYQHDSDECELAASVVALAEGGAALTDRRAITEREYGQHAVTATIIAERAASDCAYERFTAQGPIALLPVEGAHALIWTVPSDQAEHLLALSDAEFERALIDRYGSRIGAVRVQGPRAAFALRLRFAHQLAGARLVLIGNSAQTLHPVAGQGFNLGVRDAYELALALAVGVSSGQGLMAGLQQYRSKRRLDRAGGALFTDGLVRAFSNDNPLIACARSAALATLDALEPAKKFLIRRMIFGAPR
jgi:2-octaprenyl-6-methoxyphenol hydroxylase